MLRIALTLTVSFFLTHAWGAGDFADALEDVPPQVVKEAAAYVEECESFGSSVSPTEDFIVTVDLNDDDEVDYIIDTGEMNASCFCGSGGCTIQAWVSDQDSYIKAFESNVREWQAFPKGNLPPLLVVDLHGTACGGVGVDLCLKALVYQDGKLIDTTVAQ